MADATSYGNEATAAALVNPGYGAERGVVETDYEVAYGREEMRAFYAATGIPLGEDEFEAAFAAAAAAEGGGTRAPSERSSALAYNSWPARERRDAIRMNHPLPGYQMRPATGFRGRVVSAGVDRGRANDPPRPAPSRAL